MEPVTLERDDRGPVTFTGEVIAQQSSRRPGADRWTVLTVYRTDSDRTPWVTHSQGVSIREGERDFNTVVTCASPKELVDSLRTRDGRLMGLGADTAELAADNDERIDEYLDDLFAEEVIA